MRHITTATLGLTSLLLLVAALHNASWRAGWPPWMQHTGEEVADWCQHPWWRSSTATADAQMAPRPWLRLQQVPGSPDQPAVLHVTLELPNQQLEVQEDSTLEEIVEMRAGQMRPHQRQAGELPSSLELELVQRITRHRTSPLRAALWAASNSLACMGSKGSTGLLTVHMEVDGDEEQLLEAASFGSEAKTTEVEQWNRRAEQQQQRWATERAAPRSRRQGGHQIGGTGSSPTTSITLNEDVLYLTPQRRQRQLAVTVGDSTTIPYAEQRLPLSAADNTYADADFAAVAAAAEALGRRLQQHGQAESDGGSEAVEADLEPAAAQEDVEEAWPTLTLFGPTRTSAQQQEQQQLDHALEVAAELNSGGAAAASFEMGDGEQEAEVDAPAAVVVRVTFLQRQHHRMFEILGGSTAAAPWASLLDQLALASQQAADRNATLGRRAAAQGAGSSVGFYLASLVVGLAAEPGSSGYSGVPHEPPQRKDAPLSSTAVVAAVDGMFAGALVATLLCIVLLVADIRCRYGWCQAAQPSPLALPVVVAADEAAAASSLTGCAAKLLA